ncbi:MAG: GNAT family N-acetyltransferase, partial [Firmicutes bacterium]|nr:GNAT family N-acetyltransferase [Bacillota bacterium]
MSDFHIIESERGQFPIILPPQERANWDTWGFPRVMIMTPRLILDGVNKGGFKLMAGDGYFLPIYLKTNYKEKVKQGAGEGEGHVRIDRKGEVEFYLYTTSEGFGYATEAVEGVKFFMKQKNVEPYLRILDNNLKSQNVAKRTKFVAG